MTVGWGPMTVDRHSALKQRGIDLHVFVRGEDVTDRCHWFDDTPSVMRAELFRHDASGRAYYDPATDGPAIEIIHNFKVVRLMSEFNMAKVIRGAFRK